MLVFRLNLGHASKCKIRFSTAGNSGHNVALGGGGGCFVGCKLQGKEKITHTDQSILVFCKVESLEYNSEYLAMFLPV